MLMARSTFEFCQALVRRLIPMMRENDRNLSTMILLGLSFLVLGAGGLGRPRNPLSHLRLERLIPISVDPSTLLEVIWPKAPRPSTTLRTKLACRLSSARKPRQYRQAS